MGHYDSCYDADVKDEGKKKHQKIKKDLIELVNQLDDDERELHIWVIGTIIYVGGVLAIHFWFPQSHIRIYVYS
jgi:hypothetical protein